jgi:FMN phosphatase YigB (HAD superfamily)
MEADHGSTCNEGMLTPARRDLLLEHPADGGVAENAAMPQHAPVRALLFDIGRVVIDIDFGRAFGAWQPASRLAPEDIARAFRHDAAYDLHERGALDAPAYCAHLRATLRLDCDDAAILAGWNAIFVAPVAGTLALIDQVRGRLPCHALSNTNAAHLQEMRRAFPEVLQRFGHVFVSHEIGHRKPEPACFAHVIRRLGCAPEEVLFFDDLAENVAGAAASGLQAVLFESPADVRRALAGRGLLD